MSIVAVLLSPLQHHNITKSQHHNTSHTRYNTPNEKTRCYTPKPTVSKHHSTPQLNIAIRILKKKKQKTRNRGIHTCCCRRSCWSPYCELWATLDDSRSTLLPAERADNVAAMLSPSLSVPVRGKRFKASCKRETQSAIAFSLEGGVSFTRYLQGNQNRQQQTSTDQNRSRAHHIITYTHTLHLTIPVALANESPREIKVEKAACTTDIIT